MKKKLLVFAIILAVLLLSFFGGLQYRQYSSWKVPVHADIKTVARVNTDALIKSFMAEYGINFSKKISRKKDKAVDSVKNTGIYFPGNIFIYNISTRLASTFFCTLPVYDLNDFKKFAEYKLNVALTDSAGIFKGSNGKLSIACNKKFISIAYSAEKEDVSKELISILTQGNILSQKDHLVKELKKQQTPFAITNGVYNITLDIEGKQLLMHSAFNKSKRLEPAPAPHQRAVGNEANLFLSANLLPAAKVFKPQYEFKNIVIETDSILKYYTGYVDVQLAGVSVQTDSITTYEYDDNFEKVAKQTITEVKVPEITLSVSTKQGMLNYLQQVGIVSVNGKLNKELFPLYGVTVSETKQMLHFTTISKNTQPTETFKPSTNFLELNMDVKKSIQTLDIPVDSQIIKYIQSLKISAQQKAGMITLDGSLNFAGSAIKEIVEIVKAL